MKTYRKALVAIDGSKTSMHALREFVRVSKDEKLRITAVSVIPPYEGDLAATWTDNMITSMRKQCDASMSEALKIARDEGVSIEVACEEGEIYERIVDFADTGSYDLIVMGKKGMSLVERAFVGSVTSRVIGYSRQDILVIPDGAKLGMQHLLIATDGSAYSEAATERAFEIAKQYKSEMKVLSVVDVTLEFILRANEIYDALFAKAKEVTDTIRQKALAVGIHCESIVKDGESVYQVIIDVAKKHKADMIIMGNLGRTGIKRLLMGSTAERVLGKANFSVLIVKP